MSLYKTIYYDSTTPDSPQYNAPGSGYLGHTTGNYWSPSTIDRARKYAVTGNADYLYKNTSGKRPEDMFIMIMGGLKKWRKKAQQMDKEGVPYYDPKGLEDTRRHNQSLTPKVPRKTTPPPPSQIWFSTNPDGSYTVKPKIPRK